MTNIHAEDYMNDQPLNEENVLKLVAMLNNSSPSEVRQALGLLNPLKLLLLISWCSYKVYTQISDQQEEDSQ